MLDQALTAIAECTEAVSGQRAVGFWGCTSGFGLELDTKGSKSGSTAANLPGLSGCNSDAFVAPLLRGATMQAPQGEAQNLSWLDALVSLLRLDTAVG